MSKQDWAAKAAERLWMRSITGDLHQQEWLDRIAALVRRAEKRGWQARQKYDQDVRMGKVKP